jgi:hypothetical protein
MALPFAKEREIIHILSAFAIDPQHADETFNHSSEPGSTGPPFTAFSRLSESERGELLLLADSNHVVLRALEPVQRLAASRAAASANAGNETANYLEIAEWAGAEIERERGRVAKALASLHQICSELEAAGCATSVIKSLDHYPDLGSDLDLYTTADEGAVAEVMTRRFQAHIEARSWGDRLAHKWNFAVPELPEAIEVHAQRLGQTGEHTRMAARFVSRRVEKTVGGYRFWVPAPEERIIVATLQRMYRHFYFRICDIVNSGALVDSGVVDFAELKRAADLGGIWPGVCSYLKIVSDYLARYRGYGLNLPKEVVEAAPFGGEKIYVRARFIRIPILPQGAKLYTRQVTRTALDGNVLATLRLSLLPPLASAAALSYKLTGSDKGIW